VNPQDTVTPDAAHPRIGRSVSLDDAAVLLGVSRRTIYNRIRRGHLQTVRTIGGSQRVLLDSIERTRSSGGSGGHGVMFRSRWERDRQDGADANSPSDRLDRGEHKEA
jgi:excisionase family DNA binding protein